MTNLALFVFVYSLVGGRLARSPISGAIIFTAFGLALGPFGVIALDAQLPGGVTLVATVVCTILLSIVVHGLSAGPLAAAFKRRS